MGNIFTLNHNNNLWRSIYDNDLPGVKQAVEFGANIEAIDTLSCIRENDTAIHVASKQENFEIIKYLIIKKANINAKNYNGLTALAIVAGRGRLDIVKYLIKHGANIKSDSLIEATGNGCLDTVKYLVEQNADVNAVTTQDKYGNIILNEAVNRNYFDTVKYLVEQNANVNTMDRDFNTLLDHVTIHRKYDMVTYLLERGAKSRMKTYYRNYYTDTTITRLIDTHVEEQKQEIMRVLSPHTSTDIAQIVVSYVQHLTE